MLTIRDGDEKHFIRKLAINELIKLKDDVSSFILEHMDEIEELAFKKPSSEPRTSEYQRHIAEEVSEEWIL